ncbi:MAG: ketoacid-CoA transferase, partial [Syntrophales bacterium]|nr:ketoacid-CoA transferase [Syntrophales bacterium]
RAAREIKDGDTVFTGTGIPVLAAMAAKKINAPHSVVFFETGAIDSRLDELPMTVAGPRVMYASACNGTMLEAFSMMQNRNTGSRVIGILGAAQIDIYGNLNTTCIGDYYQPKIRFPGSGGACDVASFVNRSIIFMEHKREKFVKKLDYFTTPGFCQGGNSREAFDYPGEGPSVVITNMAVMAFEEESKKMYLKSFYPGITPEKVLENMEFEVDISRAREEEPPTEYELRILREEIDPQRLIL